METPKRRHRLRLGDHSRCPYITTNSIWPGYSNILQERLQMLVNFEGRLKLANAVKIWDYNLVFIRHTWLSENIIDNELHLEDYPIQRRNGPAEGEKKHAGELIVIENITCCHKIKSGKDGFLTWGDMIKGSFFYVCFLYSPPKNGPVDVMLKRFKLLWNCYHRPQKPYHAETPIFDLTVGTRGTEMSNKNKTYWGRLQTKYSSKQQTSKQLEKRDLYLTQPVLYNLN